MLESVSGQGQGNERSSRSEDEEIDRLREVEHLLRRQNEHLTALHETSLGLINRLDKEELLEVILHRAARLSHTGSGFIYLLEPGDPEMQMRVGMGFFENQLGRRVKMGEGVGGKVWENQEPLVVDDYHLWKDRISDRSLDALCSVVGIPLKDERRFHGVIGLARVDPDKKFQEETSPFWASSPNWLWSPSTKPNYTPLSAGNWANENKPKKPCAKARSDSLVVDLLSGSHRGLHHERYGHLYKPRF